MGILLLRALVGGLAGLAAWALIEPSAPAVGVGSAWSAFEVRLILTLSGSIGLAVGGLNGWLQGSRVHLLRGALVGGVLGAVGGMLGYGIGGSLRDAILGPGAAMPGMGLSPTEIVARIAGITPMAACLGAAIGASSLNWRRAVQGAIGGAIGGALGGAVFDLIGSVLSATILAVRGQVAGEVGIASRAVTALTVGAGIGLFIGIVERMSRQAWVRLRLGRNEGKEWIVDSPQVFLGRSETAQIPLFGDQSVAPMHACIMKRGTNYVLVDGGSPAGTYLNGQRVQEAILSHQAQIRIGDHHLEFLMKVGSIPQKVAEVYRGHPYPGTPHAPAPIAPQPPAAAATPGLVAVSGPLTGQRFPVPGLIEVGRETPGITLGFDGSASRRHATFAPAPGGLVVTDLGSTNGTFVNDQRVQSTTIRPGDIVKIGVTAFRVE